MKLTIKDIACDNYKGLPKANFAFYPKTSITGKNAEGKSTLMDIYFDVMTGKLADGTSPDNVRPHDPDGKVVNYVPVRREIDIDIDGQYYELEKITEQKWRVPKGQTEEVFDGNVTSYKINGFDKKAKDFDEWKRGIVNPDTLLLCSNAQVFVNILNKSTNDARKTLEQLAGFDLNDFLIKHPEYAEVDALLCGNPIEDVIKQFKRNLKKQKESLEKQRTVVAYEQTRLAPDEEIKGKQLLVDSLDAQLADLNKQIADLDTELAEVEVLKAEKAKIINDQNEARFEARKAVLNRQNTITMSLNGIKAKKDRAELDRDNAKRKMDETEAEIAQLELVRNELTERYRTVKARTVQSVSNTCLYCGQILPSEKVKELYQKFDSEKARELTGITDQGMAVKTTIDKLKAELTEHKHNFDLYTNVVESYDTNIAELEENLKATQDELQNTALTNENTSNFNLRAIDDKLIAYDAKIAVRGDMSVRQRELSEQRASADAILRYAEKQRDDQVALIKRLEGELKTEAQRCADIEKNIDTLARFSVAKNAALADMVNPHFRHFKFTFMDYTNEGNPYETCRMVVKGTAYNNGLNGGDKKLVEIDLCRGLQELNGLCLPIFVDEANTIDAWRVPQDLEQQLIVIKRTDDVLTVKEGF